MSNQPQTEQNCGHNGVDWNGEGDCIACARDKVLTEVNLCPNCYTMKHLTSSGVCGRCEPEQPQTELDEILAKYWRTARSRNTTTPPEEHHLKAKQAILDWHNKQQERAVREARIDELTQVWFGDSLGSDDLAENVRLRMAELTKGEQE